MKILILSASLTEIKPFLSNHISIIEYALAWKYYSIKLYQNNHIFVAATGLGAHAAASSSVSLIKYLQPDFVVVCGTAGGLREHQNTGDLLMIKSAVQAELWALKKSDDPGVKTYLYDPHDDCEVRSVEILHPYSKDFMQHAMSSLVWSRLPTMHVGSVITSQCFPFPEYIEKIMQEYDCIGIDMETFAVMDSARRLNVPVVPLRVISNVIAKQQTTLNLKILHKSAEYLAVGLNILIDLLLSFGIRNNLSS